MVSGDNMELSKRLKWIVEKLDKCDTIMDIGTDHGYIPIYLIKNNLANRVIASDINKEPLQKARMNASMEGVIGKVDLRKGGGLSPLINNEAQGIIVAGMGANLIRDILEADIDKVKSLDYIVLQPAQNPEVLREYLYTNDYEIIDEDICVDEGKYYELFKVRFKVGEYTKLEPIFYEISPLLLNKKSDEFREYLLSKIEHYKKVITFIKEETQQSLERKNYLKEKIDVIEKFLDRF